MPTLRIMGFSGLVPRTSATFLTDSQAQVAQNARLYQTELRSWFGQSFAQELAHTFSPQTIYHLYTATASLWLAWPTEVSVAPGPLADVTEGRIYYTDAGYPKKTNLAMATGGSPPPASWLPLGVPVPAIAPAVTTSLGTTATNLTSLSDNVAPDDSLQITTPQAFDSLPSLVADTSSVSTSGNTIYLTLGSGTGVSDSGNADNPNSLVNVTINAAGAQSSSGSAATDSAYTETRAYVYTYISQFGSLYEESGPSPPSALVDVTNGATVQISGFAAPPDNRPYNIVSMRIYRSVPASTNPGYEFVAEIPTGSAIFDDNLTALQLGQTIPSIGWLPPPDELSGIISHPNGFLAGFSGNTVYFSDLDAPHAWPVAYAISIAHPIVGLGISGSQIVVCTNQKPYIISGAAPGAMSVEELPLVAPCLSIRTIASDEDGVVYACPDGLVVVAQGLAQVVTEQLYKRDEWQAISPADMRGILYDGCYFGIYTQGDTGRASIVVDRADSPALTTIQLNATAAHLDDQTAALFLAASADGNIYEYDGDANNPLTYVWMSKRFTLGGGMTFSAMQVDADYTALSNNSLYQFQLQQVQAANAAIFMGNVMGSLNMTPLNTYAVNGSAMQPLPAPSGARWGQLSIFGDEVLQATFQLQNYEPFRIPAFRSRALEIVVSGNLNVRGIALGTTVAELRNINYRLPRGDTQTGLLP